MPKPAWRRRDGSFSDDEAVSQAFAGQSSEALTKLAIGAFHNNRAPVDLADCDQAIARKHVADLFDRSLRVGDVQEHLGRRDPIKAARLEGKIKHIRDSERKICRAVAGSALRLGHHCVTEIDADGASGRDQRREFAARLE